MPPSQRIVRLDRLCSSLRTEFDEQPRRRLTDFFGAWRSLPQPVRRSNPRTIDPQRLEHALLSLGEPVATSRTEGRYLNPWVAAGLKRGEVRNASVLANLWRVESSGRAARDFLDAFLRHLERRTGASLPGAAQLSGGYRVRTEHCLGGESSERVDLTVEGREFVIGFEIKIDAPEGEAQLERYIAALTERGKLRRSSPFLIFLAPYPHRGTIADPCPVPIVDATWQDLKIAAEQVCDRASDYNFTHDLIGRFADHAAAF